MRKLIKWMLCALLMLNTAACSKSNETKLYEPGTYTAVSKGFGGDINLTLTVDESSITDVEIIGDHETANIGSKAVEEMKQQILDAQGDEVDGVSGATVTSNAIREALKAAINQAKGISLEEVKLNDGEYTSQASSYAEINGLATTGSLTMKVTIKNHKIDTIEVPEFTDTDIIGGMAFPMLSEKVIKTQSMNIDAISGATVSSNAFFTALSDCIEQAGGDVSLLKNVEYEKAEPKSEEITTDILVIGAGMAGLTAAIEAAEQGANVILLEKNNVYSSSTTRSLGFIVGADTETQKANDIEDSSEAFYQDIVSLYEGEEALDLDLIHKMAYESSELNTWLSNHGLEFTGVINKSDKGERAVKRIHTTASGSVVTSTLVKAAEDAGVKILMGTPATSLIQESDGSISGALATNNNGDTITIHAQSTIVAAGSYTNDEALFNELNPLINNIAYACGSGEGDAYRWFKEVGADIVEIPYTQFMYYSYATSFEEFPEVIPNSPDNPVYDILLVTGGAERVTAEDNFCFEFTKENWIRGYNEGYAIVGAEFAEKYPILMKNVLNNVVPGSGLPFAYQADTIAELAQQTGLDVDVLESTVNRYNELCDQGIDADFGKDSQYMQHLDAPYTIIRLPMITTDGYTGARINENSQVLDTNGEWIKGLYAAGSCADGQTVSVNYFGCGTSLMTCGVFGRAAAIHAVSQLNK